MAWYNKIFKAADDWRMVKIWTCPYHSTLRPAHPSYSHSDPSANRTDYEYSYYLYENQYSGRKLDVIDSDRGDLDMKTERKDSFVFRNEDYRNIIRPWLDGQYNPEIPSYESIKAKEFKDNLAGKVT